MKCARYMQYLLSYIVGIIMEFIRQFLFDNSLLIESIIETQNDYELIIELIHNKINSINYNQTDEQSLSVSDINNLISELL